MGYWSNHKYKRRSVTKDSELGFLGWKWIAEQLNKFKTEKARRNRALFLTIFKTGARINEVLSLQRSNFIQEGNHIVIIDMMKEKDKDNKTYLPIRIPKQEPFNAEWIMWINDRQNWLFPSPNKEDKSLSYIRAYQIITSTGTYPHFLRSQRSSMEMEYYNINPDQIVALRQWKTDKMKYVYARGSIKKQAEEKMLEKFT